MKRIFLITASILYAALSLWANERTVIVSKQRMMLYVVDNASSDTLFSAPVGCGINYGNKLRRGDHKTPEGTFTIISTENARSWSHDFNDGAGKRKHAYGDWFFRLRVSVSPHIGIHGTCFPETIGTRSSDGCIRLRNDDLNRLRPFIKVGMKCRIEPDEPGKVSKCKPALPAMKSNSVKKWSYKKHKRYRHKKRNRR